MLYASKNKLKQVTESVFSHYFFLLENRFYTIKEFICRLQKRTSARIVVKFGFPGTVTENDEKYVHMFLVGKDRVVVGNH